MSTTGLQDFSGLLLQLYRHAHELPIEEFQDAALRLIKPVLPFDSCMWGTASRGAAGIDIHTLHLHNQSMEMIESYERVKHLDTAAAEVARHPRSTLAFNADAWFSQPQQNALRDHGRRHEQANFFITSDVNPDSGLVHWITLFRADAEAHGTPAETALLSALAPHAMQALSLNRIVHLDRLDAVLGTAQRGCAIGDLHGVLYHADLGFEQSLRGEWPRWHGRKLPGAMVEAFAQSRRYLGRTFVASHHVEQRLLFIKCRARCRADDLTPREHTVAQLVARGNTHKEIATMLHRAPATVRNHIQSIYEKLEVGNVAGLIQELGRAG